MLLLGLGLFAVGYYFAATKDAHLNPEKLVFNEQSVTVYDRFDAPVKNVSAFFTRQTVKIEDIPKQTQLAFVSAEDKRFYAHNGFDIKRIVKAALNNLKAHSFKEGASTISQQLIKNTHLSQEKTIKRKLKEWKLTRALERKYTKNEILEKYLNTIYFGHSCFGIRAAAEFYFGKTPQELTLSDSAILAGLVKSPNNYSPLKNPQNCSHRKAIVLSLMQSNGAISEAQRKSALNEALPSPEKQTHSNHSYLSFVFDELGEIASQHNLRLGGQIVIHTGLEPNIQASLDELCEKDFGCDKSVFIADALTGNYKACVSTVGNIKRLPGSLIKPLLVYAPAIEENILVPATPILDEKVNYGGYTPENYDRKYHGYVSARECVSSSLNVPAVKVLQSVGVKRAVGYTEKLGLSIPQEDLSLALALGGMKNGFPLRDILSAYSALQNGGIYTSYNFITEIFINGIKVYQSKQKNTPVFSQESAYLMTDMLKTAAKEGTAKKLRSLPFDIAAKTGTVGTEHGNTDAYALSYTTRDVTAVWFGNADNSFIPYTGGGEPCGLLYAVNEALNKQYQEKHITVDSFTKPNGIVEVSLDKTSYYDTHNMLLSDEQSPLTHRINELFKKSNLPTKKCDFFSNPSILPPTLSLTNNQVIIALNPHSPKFYQYKIDRYDYATHTTVYDGPYLAEFIDDTVSGNQRYVYTVTPYYCENKGVSVTLPTVNTDCFQDKIMEKEWWQY